MKYGASSTELLSSLSAIMTDQTKTKSSAEHIDTVSVNDHPLKPQHDHEELDRFGAALVKSPAEVALVKKLDLYMMVGVPKSGALPC